MFLTESCCAASTTTQLLPKNWDVEFGAFLNGATFDKLSSLNGATKVAKVTTELIILLNSVK